MIDYYKYEYKKRNESDLIYWADVYDCKGLFLFTFDKKTIFNLFDYPLKLTKEQVEIFQRENPFWAEHIKRRVI